jgi:hypothetical protein
VIVPRFCDNDTGYEEWLAANPDQFVLNTERNPTPKYLVLHRATCRTISGTPSRGTRWTDQYIKFCGTRQELEAFARTQVGGTAWPCKLCITPA